MKIKKLLIGATTGIIAAGFVPSIVLTTSSCSKEKKQEELISVVSTEAAILNKATYTFTVNLQKPDEIKLVWIRNKDISQKVRILNNHGIAVDPTTGQFQLNFEILPKPNKWTTLTFALSFNYEIDDQTFTYTIPQVQLTNGTTQTNDIHVLNGSTKLLTSYEDDAIFNFYFGSSKTNEIPATIDNVTMLDLPSKYKSIITLTQETGIYVDPTTQSFDIGINLSEEISEPVSFSFLISYYIGEQNYCYYSNTMTVILYQIDDQPRTYLTFNVQENSGLVSYKCDTSSTTPHSKNLFYRINDTDYWSYLPLNETISVKAFSKVEFCGINDTWSTASDRYYFSFNIPIHVSGSPESLIHGGVVSNTLSGDYCFSKLFWNCTNLQQINSDFLPMHALTRNCYDSMFDGCTNLSCHETFNLPAKVLKGGCYRRLFAGTLINDIKYYANNIPETEYTYQWLEGCLPFGSVTTPSDVDLSTMTRSTSTVPEGWDDSNQFKEPLTIIAKENGAISLHGYKEDDTFDPTYLTDPNKQIYYSYNYPNEQFKQISQFVTESISLPQDEYVYIQGDNPNGWYNKASGDTHHLGFYSEGAIELHGNIMSLVDSTLQTTVIPHTDDQWAGFPNLFSGNDVLTIGPKVLDVSNTLPAACFRHMFSNCPHLDHLGSTIRLIKELSLKSECCKGMFSDCVALETIGVDDMVPQALAPSCFQQMFSGCINLETAPLVTNVNLDAAAHCFDGMFNNCLALISSRSVVSRAAANYCYANMFSSCISLLKCPDTGATLSTDSDHCYYSMYKNCSSIVDIPIFQGSKLFGNSTCESMFELCIKLEPDEVLGNYISLNSTGIGQGCFKNMFAKCSRLQYVHVDMDGQGKDFEELPIIDSAFEGWLPVQTSTNHEILLRNYKDDFDFVNVPAAFAPQGWFVWHPENLQKQPLSNGCCVYRKEN